MESGDTVATKRFDLPSLISKWRSVLPGHGSAADVDDGDEGFSLSEVGSYLRKLTSGWHGSAEPATESADAGPVADDDPGEQPAPASTWDDAWVPDRFLDGFEMTTYHMPARQRPEEEPANELTATLVRHGEPAHHLAVLYLHGWNEYFYQSHMAAAFEALGYDFYALDLHRYGRSLREGELPGYMEDVAEYDEEIDAALSRIAADHRHLVLYAHSTGGLIAALWASTHPGRLAGVVLNSPWLDLQGSSLIRAVAPPLMKGLATAKPTMVIPLPGGGDLYGRSLHRDYEGEWDYDLTMKPLAGNPIRPGWLNAVIAAQDKVAAGLAIDCPVLMVCSARSATPKVWGPEVSTSDIVLDVGLLAARAPLLGWHVTLVRLDGAVHDVSLSAKPVRDRYVEEIDRWDAAYVRPQRQPAVEPDGDEQADSQGARCHDDDRC